jgi:hypothetical protein
VMGERGAIGGTDHYSVQAAVALMIVVLAFLTVGGLVVADYWLISRGDGRQSGRRLMCVAGGWRRVQQFWSIAALSWGILLAVLSVTAKPSKPAS